MRKYACLIMLILLMFLTGCDSESDSSLNERLYPASPIGPTKTLEVPAIYPTIQKAINAAGSGDMIRVAKGVYQEDLSIRSKNFSLRGAGKGLTTIEGTVEIYDNEEVSFEGFTVLYGGIHARNSSVKITGNEIGGNIDGPGLWLDRCKLIIISDNDIHHNAREGILVEASQGVIGSNGVAHNTMDGIVINNASPGLTGNRVSENGRDGIAIRGFQYNASPHLVENIVQDNGGISNYDIICFGGNANPTGVGNVFNRCINCGECRSFGYPVTYQD